MAIQTENFEFDPLSRPTPGQSFTDVPGKNPYEKQPMVVSPKQAMDSLTESLEEPRALSTVLNLLDAGISSETIASSLVLKMFSEGVFTPDIAEIVKPPLVSHITKLGIEAGVEEIAVINSVPKEPMGSSDSFNLMSKINPGKFNRQMNEFDEESAMGDMASQIDFGDEDAGQEPRESFLDMEVA